MTAYGSTSFALALLGLAGTVVASPPIAGVVQNASNIPGIAALGSQRLMVSPPNSNSRAGVPQGTASRTSDEIRLSQSGRVPTPTQQTPTRSGESEATIRVVQFGVRDSNKSRFGGRSRSRELLRAPGGGTMQAAPASTVHAKSRKASEPGDSSTIGRIIRRMRFAPQRGDRPAKRARHTEGPTAAPNAQTAVFASQMGSPKTVNPSQQARPARSKARPSRSAYRSRPMGDVKRGRGSAAVQEVVRPSVTESQRTASDLRSEFELPVKFESNYAAGPSFIMSHENPHSTGRRAGDVSTKVATVPSKPKQPWFPVGQRVRHFGGSGNQSASAPVIAGPKQPESEPLGSVDAHFVVTDEQLSTTREKPPIVTSQSQVQPRNRSFASGSPRDGVDFSMAPTVPAPTAVPFTDRNKIFYRPAVLDVNRFGQPVLRPSVQVSSSQHGLTQDVKYVLPEGEQLPPPEAEYVVPETWSAPIVDGPYEQYGVQCAPSTPRLGPLQEALCRVRACLNGPRTPEPGIGTERVGNAISFLDTTQPMNNCRLRLDAASNYESPDRAEYFWAKIGGGGPSGRGGEIDVDYQDVRMYWEIGGEKFSVGTDIPIRVIDPVIYDNSGGLGDINIQTKILFLDGRRWQMSNLLRVYIPSGDRSQGIGTGHASIEPGLAWRYKWSDVTYLHANLKFWVPLGADQLHGGEVLDYGLGLSHVLYDGDRCAIMPTFEMVGYYFMDGQVTLPIGVEPPVAVEVDSEGILNIHPGIRWVWDNGNDCGVREFGLFGGYSVTSDSLYETLLRAEFRWIW